MKITILHRVLGGLFAIYSGMYFWYVLNGLQLGGGASFLYPLAGVVIAAQFFRLAKVSMNIEGHFAFLIFSICASVFPLSWILYYFAGINFFGYGLSTLGILISVIYMFAAALSIFFGFVTLKNQK